MDDPDDVIPETGSAGPSRSRRRSCLRLDTAVDGQTSAREVLRYIEPNNSDGDAFDEEACVIRDSDEDMHSDDF